MKLYIWAEPYSVAYGSSMVFAVAENLNEARKQAAKGKAYSFGQYQDINTPGVTLGKPTRVVELPCAEWHHWEE